MEQAGENKNALIYRANSTVIIDGLSGDGEASIEEVIKKVQCSFLILRDWCGGLVSEHG